VFFASGSDDDGGGFQSAMREQLWNTPNLAPERN
jgi:hypothetical protein